MSIRQSSPRHPAPARALLGAAVFVTTVGMFAACSGGPTPSSESTTPAPPAVQSLSIVPWSYDPQKGGASSGVAEMQEIADEYEAKTGVAIEFVRQPVDEYGTWLNTQLAGGTAPDIVLDGSAAANGVKGLHVDLGEYLDDPNPYAEGNTAWRELFMPGVLEILQEGGDGRQFSVAPDLTETAVFYNKDFFTANGLTPPTKWADWKALADRTRAAGMETIISTDGLMSWWPLGIIGDMIMQDQIAALDTDSSGTIDPIEYARGIKSGTFDPTTGSSREAWRVLQEWSQDWAKDYGINGLEAVEMFVRGKAAMIWTHTGVFPMIRDSEARAFEFDTFYLPPVTAETSSFGAGREPVSVGGPATSWAVTSAAQKAGRAEQAVDFLMFLTAPANVERYVNASGSQVPGVVGAEPNPELGSVMGAIERGRPHIRMFYPLDAEGQEQFTRTAETEFGPDRDLDAFLQKLKEINTASAERAAKANNWDI